MKKNKVIILTSIIVGVLVVMLGLTYASLSFNRTGGNSQLVLGDIWMHYNETNQVVLSNAMPSSTYDETKYFEFTIDGKNTYLNKDIWYEIVLNHGDNHETRTERIKDKLLKFTLVEIVNGEETVVVNAKSYEEINNTRIWVNTISKNTTEEVNRTYRLYMWISDSTLIGNIPNADYDIDTWNNQVYASIKVSVNGDFNEKELPLTPSETLLKAIDEKAVSNPSCKTYVEEDGIIYISGTKDCIDFNYVWYSGKLWRITAIYPDGTMKMITDSNITTINWGATSTVSDTDLTSAYSTSYMREWLNQEFLPTLYNYENIIVEDAGWYSITDSASTPTKPTGDYTLTDPVGLLNAYEYYMSYKNTSYGSGYLNIGYSWWLITLYSSSSVRYVNINGNLYSSIPSSYSYGSRPSINLKSTIQLSGGTGTQSNPYRIKGDIEEVESNATLINTRISGEYVKLENDETESLYRIVDTETITDSETSLEKLTTKIVLNDYVKESGTILTKNFSSSSSHELWTEVDKTDTTYWRGYLNNTWLAEIDNTYNAETSTSSILEKGTYYLGYHKTGSYKGTVCSTVSSDVSIEECIENGGVVSNTSSDDYVGLLRVGEMFASQTRDYTYSNASYHWLITPYSSAYVRNVNNYDTLNNTTLSQKSHGSRPSINLKSEIIIKSGSGTQQDPFIVGLPS